MKNMNNTEIEAVIGRKTVLSPAQGPLRRYQGRALPPLYIRTGIASGGWSPHDHRNIFAIASNISSRAPFFSIPRYRVLRYPNRCLMIPASLPGNLSLTPKTRLAASYVLTSPFPLFSPEPFIPLMLSLCHLSSWLGSYKRGTFLLHCDNMSPANWSFFPFVL